MPVLTDNDVWHTVGERMLRDQALLDTVRQPGAVKTQVDALVEQHVALHQSDCSDALASASRHTSAAGPSRMYIRLSVDRSKIPPTGKEHVQHFAVFSNGDTSTAGHCTNAVARDFRGQEHVSWPSEDCYDLKVVYSK